MKNLFNIFTAALMVFATTGFTITKHYCGGKLVTTEVYTTPESCCDVNGGCCQNETEVYQLKKDFTFLQAAEVDFIAVTAVFLFCNEMFALHSETVFSSVYMNKGYIPPPLLSARLAARQSFLL